MEVPLNRILAQRRTGLRLWRGRRSAILSLALHLAVVAALFLGPLLLADRPKPVEYVQVTIVPAASLPRPAPPPKPRPEPPKPRREEPKPKPPPEDAPVLPSPEKPEPEPPPPQEAGSAETEEESAPNVGPAREGPATVQGLDDPTFTYGYYVDRMLSLIRARWQRPPVGGDVEVVVHFRILRNGHVDQVRIVTPSGIDAFDLAGLRAIQAASPLPPLPQGYRKSSLGVTLIMR